MSVFKSFTFYKTSLRQVWRNYQELRRIKDRARYFDDLHWDTPPEKLMPTLKIAFDNGAITRREYQLYLRTRRDIRRLIPFSLILLVCGEWTPAIFYLIGSRVAKVVPVPCLTPHLAVHELTKSGTVEHVVFPKKSEDTGLLDKRSVPSFTSWKSFDKQLAAIDKEAERNGQPRGGSIIGRNWFRPDADSERRILTDALLILWEGGVQTLDNHEVSMWVWQTGDLYLSCLWDEALLAYRKGNISETETYHELREDVWNSHMQELDLKDVRQELQLTFEELEKRMTMYFKNGLDYDPTQDTAENGSQPIFKTTQGRRKK